jgi:GNAT superfamily N-acetyltransferase
MMARFDVFISYKYSDGSGNPTEDYFIAEELYKELCNNGLNVFFSKHSLENMGISEYKKEIDVALDQSNVLVVVTTSTNNVNSDWVRYEWESFHGDILSGIKKEAKIFSYIDKITTTDLPRTLRHRQVFEKRLTTLHEVTNFINNALHGNEKAVENLKSSVTDIPKMNYCIIDGKSVTDEDIAQALQLDRLVYTEEYYVTLERCISWFRRNNQIYTMLKDTATGKIIAYVNVSPITDEYYDRIRNGDFVDTYLPPEAIIEYDMPCLYNLYFSSIVIHPDFQNTGSFKPLFDALVNKFIKLGENEVFLRRMIADAVTDKGLKFCELFGMKKIHPSNHQSTIFEVQLIPPEFKVTSKATDILYRFYKQKAEEIDYL